MSKRFLEAALLAFIIFCLSFPLHVLVSNWIGRDEAVFYYLCFVGAPVGFGVGIIGAAVSMVVERYARITPSDQKQDDSAESESV